MALINCNHCGGVVSDKATVCPHCGKDPHEVEAKNEPVTADEGTDNGKLTVCPHCGGTVSRKATVCPHCGTAVSAPTATANTVATAGVASVNTVAPVVKQPEVADTDAEDDLEEESSSKNLKIVLMVVGLIAVIFILVLVFFTGAFKKNDTSLCYADSVDTVAVADTAAADTIYTMVETEKASADTTSLEDALSNDATIDGGQMSEYGFRSDADVREFLAGRTYYCDDKSMKITSQGIYVNGSDISTSYPEFTQVSGNVGRVTANPSVSITVRRDENMLIDNRSGERYYLSE